MEKRIDSSVQWTEELTLLRSVIDKAGMDVAIKMGHRRMYF